MRPIIASCGSGESEPLLGGHLTYREAETTGRKGDWMLTAGGRQFWPLDPRPEEVFAEDIAHHLGMLCRYNGAARYFYSVAEHSVLMCQAAPPHLKRWCLLHDAPEGLGLGDMIRPVKRHMPEYKPLEERLMRAVAVRFGLVPRWPMPPEVKELDECIGLTEKRAILPENTFRWDCDFEAKEPLDVDILCLEPSQARDFWMSEWRAHGVA
jgi:hypothetical protein